MEPQLCRYLTNCFLLLIPVLTWNVCLAKRLPWGYAPGGPWDHVPVWLGAVESGLRACVLALPLLMRLEVSSAWQRAGLWLYVVGVIAYGVSWSAQVWAPNRAWSRSMLGFLAPAYTAGIWLTGIGMVGERLLVELPYRRSIYLAAVVAFVAVHTWHAYLAYDWVRRCEGAQQGDQSDEALGGTQPALQDRRG